MGVALWAAKEAKRQADAALGEVEPLIFLDSVAFENPQSVGGRGTGASPSPPRPQSTPGHLPIAHQLAGV